MVPRPALSFALLSLVVTAGCLTAPPPGNGTETATRTPTPTAASPATPPTETTEMTAPPETTVYGTDCPPYLGAEPASDRQVEGADRAVRFGELSAERRRQFERALENEVTIESGSEYFWIGTVVEYQGQYYATYVAVC